MKKSTIDAVGSGMELLEELRARRRARANGTFAKSRGASDKRVAALRAQFDAAIDRALGAGTAERHADQVRRDLERDPAGTLAKALRS